MLRFVPFALVLLLAGCGGGNDSADTKTEQAAPATATPGLTPGGDRGVGPVDQVDVASLDPARATTGAELFKAKCSACHKIEERYIGPALIGVTERRRPEWIMNMMMNPDVMVKEDPTARALLAEFLAPMTNQNVTRDEAESILTFFLSNDKDLEHDEEQDTESLE